MLGQPVKKATYVSLPIAYIGVLLVAKPPLIFGGQGMGLTEFLIGCSQALFASMPKLSVTILGSTEPVSHIIASVAIVSCVGSILVSVFILHDWVLPHRLVDVGFFLGVGLCACVVQLAGTLALKRENVSSVMVMSYTGIVWSIFLDYAVFDMVPHAWGVVGAVLIVGSNIGLAIVLGLVVIRKAYDGVSKTLSITCTERSSRKSHAYCTHPFRLVPDIPHAISVLFPPLAI